MQHEVTLFTNQSASGVSATVKFRRVRRLAVYARFSSGASAGVVTVETSSDRNYSGTWHSLGTLTAASDTEKVLFVDGPLLWVRARISTAISGGTVSVYAVAI